MSKIYYCDRCGKEIAKLPMSLRIRRIIFSVERHFCWDCYNKIVDFAFDRHVHHVDKVE